MTATTGLRQFVVVENAGMIGESTAGKFGTYWAAQKWMEKTYSANERDPLSPNCLHVEICVEEGGARSYDL